MPTEIDPDWGKDFPKDTPELAAKKRRGEWQGAVLFFVMGAIIFVYSVDVAWTQGLGAMIAAGPRNNYSPLPWWCWAGMGLFLMGLCSWWVKQLLMKKPD
jgi:hypothetical protein